MGSPTPCGCGDDPNCNVGCVHPVSVWAIALIVNLGCPVLWGISVSVALIMSCTLGKVFFFFGFHGYASPSRITTWFENLRRHRNLAHSPGSAYLEMPWRWMGRGLCPITAIYLAHIFPAVFSKLPLLGQTIQSLAVIIGIIWYSIVSIVEPAMTNSRLQRFSHLDIVYFSDRRGDIHIYLYHLFNITPPTFHEGVPPVGFVTT